MFVYFFFVVVVVFRKKQNPQNTLTRDTKEMPKEKKSRTNSKGGKGGKNRRKTSLPPPIVLRIRSKDDFGTHITNYPGMALLAVVTPHCNEGVKVVVPFMEKLNEERQPPLNGANIVVMYTDEETKELCKSLEVHATPAFFAYSFGALIESFAGSNLDKALLIAKIAAQTAQEEEARLAAESKLQLQQEQNAPAS